MSLQLYTRSFPLNSSWLSLITMLVKLALFSLCRQYSWPEMTNANSSVRTILILLFSVLIHTNLPREGVWKLNEQSPIPGQWLITNSANLGEDTWNILKIGLLQNIINWVLSAGKYERRYREDAWSNIMILRFSFRSFGSVQVSDQVKTYIWIANPNLTMVVDETTQSIIFWCLPVTPNRTSFVTSIKRNVPKLVLFGAIDRPQNILDCVFSSTSIVNMELGIQTYVLTWSETWTLPKLQKMMLKFLTIDQATSRDLLSCCPALETLSIMFCNMTSFKTFQVSSPRLTESAMSHCPGMGDCSFSFQTPSLAREYYD